MITYVVEGSEDGVLLGTTSKKAAIKQACDYVNTATSHHSNRLSNEIRDNLKEFATFTVYVDANNLNARITVFDSKG